MGGGGGNLLHEIESSWIKLKPTISKEEVIYYTKLELFETNLLVVAWGH